MGIILLDWIDYLWVVFAVIGVIYCTKNTQEALVDWRFVRNNNIANGRKFVASFHLRSLVMRLAILIVMAAISVLTVLHALTRTSQQFIELGWLIITMLMLICSINDRNDQKHLISIAEKDTNNAV